MYTALLCLQKKVIPVFEKMLSKTKKCYYHLFVYISKTNVVTNRRSSTYKAHGW